jgi:hypothetical protein
MLVMVKRIIMVVMVLLAFAANAGANQGTENAPKSIAKAKKLSLYGTVIPVVTGAVIFFGASDRFENWDDGESIVAASIAGAGIILGPALGHCYAGEWRYLGKAIWLRMTIAGLAVGAAAWSASSSGSSGGKGFVMPSFLMVFSAIWDITKVKNSVEKFNSSHSQRAVSLNPCYFTQHDAIGLQLSMTL